MVIVQARFNQIMQSLKFGEDSVIKDLVPSSEGPRTASTRSLKDGDKQQANAAQVASVAADL